MPNADLTREVIDTAMRLINQSRSGEVSGDEVAQALGRDVDHVDVHYSFREAERLGELECLAWGGGMGLPAFVRLPPVR